MPGLPSWQPKPSAAPAPLQLGAAHVVLARRLHALAAAARRVARAVAALALRRAGAARGVASALHAQKHPRRERRCVAILPVAALRTGLGRARFAVARRRDSVRRWRARRLAAIARGSSQSAQPSEYVSRPAIDAHAVIATLSPPATKTRTLLRTILSVPLPSPLAVANVVSTDHEDDLLGHVGRVICDALEVLGDPDHAQPCLAPRPGCATCAPSSRR